MSSALILTWPVATAVLFGALLHAGWNVLVKSGSDKAMDNALIPLLGSLVALPVLLVVGWPAAAAWPFILASAVIHLGYYTALTGAYKHGDLGLTYPLMRGTAPLLVALFGVALLDEHPGATMWLGIVLISAGILSLGLLQRARAQRSATRWALANAAIIASYTLVDGAGARLSGAPAGYVAWLFWLQGLLFVALVAVLKKRAALDYIGRNWQRGLGGGLCLISAYGIVLWAMTQAPVAAVAALRETSVIFAALIGTIFLKERFGRQRLIAACAVALGIIALRI